MEYAGALHQDRPRLAVMRKNRALLLCNRTLSRQHATKRGKKAGKLPIVTATRSLLTLPLALYLVASAAAHAQTYPDRAIRLVVPAGQGGPTDTLARLIAERLSASLRQN